jgi:hypothetical protein
MSYATGANPVLRRLGVRKLARRRLQRVITALQLKAELSPGIATHHTADGIMRQRSSLRIRR